ncbi:hypothetical protein ACJ51O_35950 (plasmid) [Burkholderia pyrrocinia]|uniref:hypothetical protein n=1 Tax=Burkholderia pyrrocinia TaxID=60550 RepID=UPI0038B5FB1A
MTEATRDSDALEMEQMASSMIGAIHSGATIKDIQCHLMLGKALARRSFSEVVAHTHDERLQVKAQAYLEGLDAVDGAVRQDESIQQP